jgi:hypothetical protein
MAQHGTFGEIAHRAVRRCLAIQCDRLWRTPLALDRFAKEGLGGSNVTPDARPEVRLRAQVVVDGLIANGVIASRIQRREVGSVKSP